MRAGREQAAYDHGQVFEHNDALKGRFAADFGCPNTLRAEARFASLVRDDLAGKAVLDVGCGGGELSVELAAGGAAYVRGIDISERFIERARAHQKPGALEFELADVSAPITGRFDRIVGRAILHHLDWLGVLERLYEDNLAPGGRLVFYEPLGSNWLLRLYWALVPGVHTPDERPFYAADLRALSARFPGFRAHGINYVSFPVGLASAVLRLPADNLALKAADRVDCWVDDRLPALRARFRQAIFVIEKPAYLA
jgi:SAM-dependent methyltransferase